MKINLIVKFKYQNELIKYTNTKIELILCYPLIPKQKKESKIKRE